MEAIRQWWIRVLERLLATLGAAWDRLSFSLLESWDLTIFVFAVLAIVLIALFVIWRRGA